MEMVLLVPAMKLKYFAAIIIERKDKKPINPYKNEYQFTEKV